MGEPGGTPRRENLAHSERIAILETRADSQDRAVAVALAQLEKTAERMENTTLKNLAEMVKLNGHVDEVRRAFQSHETVQRRTIEEVDGIKLRMAKQSGEHAALSSREAREAKEALSDSHPSRGKLTHFIEHNAVKVIVVLFVTLVSVLVGRATAVPSNPEEIATKAIEQFVKKKAEEANP